jgi:hypothetical protein
VNHSLRNAAEKFMNHNGFIIFGYRVKCLLDNMTAKGIHGKAECVTTNGFSNLNDLLGSAMLEATLDEEIPEAINQ